MSDECLVRSTCNECRGREMFSLMLCDDEFIIEL